MVNFGNFVLVVSAMSMAAVNCKRPIGTGSKLVTAEPVYRPLQATRAPVVDKRDLSSSLESSNSSDFTPTSVIPQKASETKTKASERLHRRTFGRFSFKQIRVHAYLVECLNGILPHTQLIKQLCAAEFNGDPERLGWNLVAKLRAILAVLNACLSNIKNCGNAPAPSGVPGGNTPSMGDICKILFNIMCEIRTCCMLIGSVCAKYSIVRQICSDTLVQITGCLSSIAVSVGGQVGNVSTGLGQLFTTIPHFFANGQFGFHAIPGVLGQSNGFFSFGDFL